MVPEFEIPITKNLYWVPLSALGYATYSTGELQKIAQLSPEEKRRYIHSLSDAVNLFNISDFRDCSDVIYLSESDGTIWEHHKPGYYSVVSNEGCCSSCASWLCYLLLDKYESMGLLTYLRPNGNGHCMNYIYHNGWYYFIDMTMRLNKHRHTIAPETGNLRDYLVSRPFANIFLRAKTIAAYTEYIAKYQKLQHRTFLFSYCPQSFAPPLSLSTKEDKIHILYPNNCKIDIVNEHEAEGLYSYEFVPPPQKKPCWIKLKDLSISER